MTERTIVTLDGDGHVQDIDGPEQFDVPVRALVPHVEPARGLARPETPGEMIGLATQMATALSDIVERQKLYTVIQGKKFPQVEAWMTIGRMDNVVARESERPVRHDDGSYEAFVELIRLSDGMIVGRASALCGTPDDRPWNGRGEPQRRSMAATRATSRAFRQQYSWIMALAGYEPTPADEMPMQPDRKPEQERDRPADGSLIGTVAVGTNDADFELRQTPDDGWRLGFKLMSPAGNIKVLALDDLAPQLYQHREAIIGKRVTCWGRIADESFTPKNSTKAITYQILELARIRVPDVGDLPTQPGTLSAEDNVELDRALGL